MFVESVWVSERGTLPHMRERSLPTGCADIIVPLLQDSIVRFDGTDDRLRQYFRGPVVQGPHDRFSTRGTHGSSSVIGVHFKPGGALPFFGGALSDLRNRTVLLEEVWGQCAVDLRHLLLGTTSSQARIHLMESFLLARLANAPETDPMVQFALNEFESHPSLAGVARVQEGSGCAPAQFIRRFQAAVGLTPKRYARVLRFNALLPEILQRGDRDWAALAIDAGYFDQSHMIHEFKRFAGLTPTAYAPVSVAQVSHVALNA